MTISILDIYTSIIITATITRRGGRGRVARGRSPME